MWCACWKAIFWLGMVDSVRFAIPTSSTSYGLLFSWRNKGYIYWTIFCVFLNIHINFVPTFQVLYRVALAIIILFHKFSTNQSSEWMSEVTKNGVESALNKFCKDMPVSPTKLLRTAFSIRGLRYLTSKFNNLL